MENLGYYNGKFGPLEEMMVPMNDRVCYFGDGVYDATYSRNGVIFALDEHIDRFFNSAGLLRIELPCTKDEMKDILNDMVSKVDSGNNFVYWQATRGTGIRNHAFPKEGKANIWVTIKPAEVKDLSQRIKLITLEDTRFLHCNIKTLNLIPSVMAAQKTAEAGCDESVFPSRRQSHRVRSQQRTYHKGRCIQDPSDRSLYPARHRPRASYQSVQGEQYPG